MLSIKKWLSAYTITCEKIHEALLQRAYAIAASSPDPRTQIGAILVTKTGEIVAQAHNRPIKDIEYESLKDFCRKRDFKHAERLILAQARKKGICTKNLTMYMPWHPCRECAKDICAAGIKELIGHQALWKLTPRQCIPSFCETAALLRGGGVMQLLYTDKVSGVKIRFKGEFFLGY